MADFVTSAAGSAVSEQSEGLFGEDCEGLVCKGCLSTLAVVGIQPKGLRFHIHCLNFPMGKGKAREGAGRDRKSVV